VKPSDSVLEFDADIPGSLSTFKARHDAGHLGEGYARRYPGASRFLTGSGAVQAFAQRLWNLAYDAGYGAGPAVFGLSPPAPDTRPHSP